MSTQSMPVVPPRPSRSQEQQGGATLGSDIPRIPPRPINKRSKTPSRERYAQSPFNEPASAYAPPKATPYSSASANVSRKSIDDFVRPSAVTMPSIGQEGNEYAELESGDDSSDFPAETHHLGNDLKVLAPKATLPVNAAKARIATVTRTDSDQAAAFGVGRGHSDDANSGTRSLKSKASSVSIDSSKHIERPPSAAGDDGIPIHGQRVPMYPNAGDVQAPSPSAFQTQFPPGIGFHNDGSKPRQHARRPSGRGFDGPPGSYGLHGHGVVGTDRFEQDYYQKHPELLQKEKFHYQEERGQWAMSSEDLNKIVHDTASRGSGFGTSNAYTSTPSEQIGFMATDDYTSRHASPRPQQRKTYSFSSQHHVDSPLRKESFNHENVDRVDLGAQALAHNMSSSALESETEDDEIVHVDAPVRRINKITGGAKTVDETNDLGPNAAPYDEHGYGAPILASDEVAKEPFAYELQPAVSPNAERRSEYLDGESLGLHKTRSHGGSQPASRPASVHGVLPGLRMPSDFEHGTGQHTPLENLEEYEPLFPEDEKKPANKPATLADRVMQRPDLKSRKFPSQDVWEDTPDSLNYTTTVSTPQANSPVVGDEEYEEAGPTMRRLQVRDGETSAHAFARQQEELAERESHDPASFLNAKKPWAKNAAVTSETRPSLKQRFPSRDVWEDNPSSLELQTTVAGPQAPEDEELLSPSVERPTTGAVVYHQEKVAAGIPLGSGEGRATTGIGALMNKPAIPTRPSKSKPTITADPAQSAKDFAARQEELAEQDSSPISAREKPAVPLASKPVVPARPQKSVDKSDLPDSSQVLKPKPVVPSRPVSSKIAALQGGFMADLNKRLGMGPVAPKKEEVSPEIEEALEKAPLSDARKSRARGPQRRAPASASKSPAPAAGFGGWGFCMPMTVWEVDEEGGLNVHNKPGSDSGVSGFDEERDTKAATDNTPTLATNIAGDVVHARSEIAVGAATASSLQNSTQDSVARDAESAQKERLVHDVQSQSASTPLKASEVPEMKTEADDDEAMYGSTATLKPVPSDEVHKTLDTQSEGEIVTEEPLLKKVASSGQEEVMPGGFQ